MQLETIAPDLQPAVIASFWTMLRELEGHARDTNDAVLYVWVEGWYRQWNAMTGDDKAPAWLSAPGVIHSRTLPPIEGKACGPMTAFVLPTKGA